MGGRAHLNETPPSFAGHLGVFQVSKGQVFQGEKKIMSLAEWGCFELAQSLESSLKKP